MNKKIQSQIIKKNKSQLLYQKLQKQYSRKIDLDLTRINLALKKLGNIHRHIINPINIIGSDGKYTTLKSLKYFIEEHKEKVSTFTSPHLFDVRHRFWLKDKFITTKELIANIKIIKKLNVKLTLFELLTLVYLISASKLKNISYALVEAGLLYAKDSTRIWDKPRCQIITNINKQHLSWVHPKTIKALCIEKVGYLSKKTVIYVGKQDPKTLKIIQTILKKNPSKKKFYGKEWILKTKNKKVIYQDDKEKIILKSNKIFSEGVWQNVGLAIRVARDLGISKKEILAAIPKIFFEGRVQYIKSGKLKKLLYSNEKLMIDGCHSNESAKNLAIYLKTLNKDIYGIWGMQSNRQPKQFLKNFEGIFKEIITVKIPDEPNSCSPKTLQKISNQLGIKCHTAKDTNSALLKLSSKKEKIIVGFGSLYLVGNFLKLN